jgi:hypothetical protein
MGQCGQPFLSKATLNRAASEAERRHCSQDTARQRRRSCRHADLPTADPRGSHRPNGYHRNEDISREQIREGGRQKPPPRVYSQRGPVGGWHEASGIGETLGVTPRTLIIKALSFEAGKFK